jgi:hypothetical protein
MLVVDDRLTFRVLTGSFGWLPEGFTQTELVTTVSLHYRLLSAILRPFPLGVHSNAFYSLKPNEQQRVLARAKSPEPVLSVLDPRPSLATAAMLAATHGRLSHLQAEAAAAAITLNAALALSSTSGVLLDICAVYGVEVHEITLF